MAITNMIPTIWAARLLEKLRKTLVYAQPGVVSRDYEGEISDAGDRVYIHSFADLTISDYVKNTTTLTYEQLTDSRVALVIDQSKYFAFKVDDIDQAQMQPKIIDAASERASYGLSEVADRYVAGLYTGASTSPDNVIETTQFTAANVYQKFVDLSVLMDQRNLPDEGRYAVVPPWVAGLLLLDDKYVLKADPEMALNGQIGRVAGINILKSNNVPTTGTTPVVHHIMAGVPSAIGYAEQISKIEGIRLEGSFGDGVRGLHLYGAKVLDGARLFDLQANQ